MSDPVTILRNALEGIASCATSCPCCAMHRSVAYAALINYDKALKEKAEKVSAETP